MADNGAKVKVGDRVQVWPGARPEGRSYDATVIDPGPHLFGSVPTCRIRKDDGGTDYIALTHVEVIPWESVEWLNPKEAAS